MNIEMALKSRSYIFDLDHVKLSLGKFFLSCFIESIFHQLSGSTFIFVKNTYKKAANLMFCLISPVEKSPAWSVEGQSKGTGYTPWFFRMSAGTKLNCPFNNSAPNNNETNF